MTKIPLIWKLTTEQSKYILGAMYDQLRLMKLQLLQLSHRDYQRIKKFFQEFGTHFLVM